MMMTRIKKTTLAFLSSASVLMIAVTQAQAAGFYIQEQSVSALGSAFSGSTTNLNDPSTVFFNPAGMTKLEGTQIAAGASVLAPVSHLKNAGSTLGGVAITSTGNGGNPYQPTPVPNAHVTYQINNQWWAGLSVTAPFGLANEYDQGWFGRFDSTKTELAVFDIQPTLAFKINDMVSIGAGINIQRASADLRSSVQGATEGQLKLTGEDWSAGYSFGVQVKPDTATTIGLNYHSGVSHTLQGNLLVTGAPGANADTKARADLNLPDQGSLGISRQLDDHWTVQGQATWFGWNRFETIAPVRADGGAASQIYQGYQNTWAFAAGAEYKANDKWTYRGGVQFDQTPTTDAFRTTRTPDGDRTWISGGATYALMPGLDLDLAATYIHIASETINVTRVSGATAVIRADTSGDVGIAALGLKYKF